MDDKPATSLQATPENQPLETVTSEEPYSYRREWLAQAWGDFCEKLGQEKTVSGVTGFALLLIAVVLFLTQSQPLLSLLPVGIFVACVVIYFIYVLFRAPGKIDERKRLAVSELHKREAALNESGDAGKRKRDFLAERLTALLKQAGDVEYGSASLGSPEGMAKMMRYSGRHTRVLHFLRAHYPEEVERFEKEGNSVLEELLAEALQEEDPTKPLINGRIEEVIFETAIPEEKIAGFDYYMTIRFWLRCKNAATNFSKFDLTLFTEGAKQSEYKGDKLLLDGTLCLDRKQYQKTSGQSEPATILTKLVDYDSATPLNPNFTREGWLRFVIRNVEYADITSDVGLTLLRLELRVTDGSGKPWTLTTKPPWAKIGPKLEIRHCPSPDNWVGLGSRARFRR